MEFNHKNIYTENANNGNEYRKAYAESINAYIKECIEPANLIRNKYVTPQRMKSNIDFYRAQLKEMLGHPLDSYEYGIPKYTQEYVGEDDFCKIYRLQINTVKEIMFYGILSVPKTDGRHPLIIAQHGGWGSPELLCGMHGENSYSNISKIALENGCAVFAPQLLIWNTVAERDRAAYDVEFDRPTVDVKLKQYGGSVTALEIYNIMKSIDCVASFECIDSGKIGMLGLSYGGYFTLYTTAIDTRIKAAYACGFFNDRNYELQNDWVYFNSSEKFHDAEVAGLCAPRRLYVDVGKTDAVFNWKTSVSEAERARKFYDVYNGENGFNFNLWNGEHRFDVGGENIKKFFEYININQ